MSIIKYTSAGIICLILLWLLIPKSTTHRYLWSVLYALIERRFPDTPTVEAKQVRRWQERDEVLLIDVRTPEEFAVSHLQGAQNWTTFAEIEAGIEQLPPHAHVVLYCSVGYRSAKLVRALGELSENTKHPQLYNLRGSIFAWVNQGNSVYRQEREVRLVHPYNETWGSLLRSDYHPASYETPAS